MRFLLCAASMVALIATTALAQDADWTGAYGGLSMATNDGSQEYDNDGDPYELEGPAFGVFGGYMWANGQLVYGAEAALTLGGVYEVDGEDGTSYKDEYEYDRFFDVKGRLGYAVSDFLLYGTLGVSRTRFRSSIGEPDYVATNTTGMIYGVGADYRFGDRYFAGGEYLRRDYDFFDAGQEVDIEAEIDTFSLRVGMKF